MSSSLGVRVSGSSGGFGTTFSMSARDTRSVQPDPHARDAARVSFGVVLRCGVREEMFVEHRRSRIPSCYEEGLVSGPRHTSMRSALVADVASAIAMAAG